VRRTPAEAKSPVTGFYGDIAAAFKGEWENLAFLASRRIGFEIIVLVDLDNRLSLLPVADGENVDPGVSDLIVKQVLTYDQPMNSGHRRGLPDKTKILEKAEVSAGKTHIFDKCFRRLQIMLPKIRGFLQEMRSRAIGKPDLHQAARPSTIA
jgi:hypothetical protein